MKVVAINGSAKSNGNTNILLEIILKELEKYEIETEIIQLSNLEINSCKACFACNSKESCINNKDGFSKIFNKMKEADGILLGSPVYGANISSKLQALIERTSVVADANPKLFTHKIGASVVACRRGGH